MFKSWQNPNKRNQDQLTQNSALQPTLNVPFQRRNNLVQQVPGAETQKTVINLALANGGGLNIWTALAGNVIFLVALGFNSSVTGRLTVLYNGVSIAQIYCIANQYTPFPIGGLGVYLYPAAASLTVTNNTGGASDVSANAWGAEVAA